MKVTIKEKSPSYIKCFEVGKLIHNIKSNDVGLITDILVTDYGEVTLKIISFNYPKDTYYISEKGMRDYELFAGEVTLSND